MGSGANAIFALGKFAHDHTIYFTRSFVRLPPCSNYNTRVKLTRPLQSLVSKIRSTEEESGKQVPCLRSEHSGELAFAAPQQPANRCQCTPSAEDANLCERCYKRKCVNNITNDIYCKGTIQAQSWLDISEI